MRVLHISSSLTNGAGKTARRINECINQKNYKSHLITTGFSPQEILNNEHKLEVPLHQTFLSKTNTFFQKFIVQNNIYLLTPLSISKIDLNTKYILNSDIINIHSMYNCITLNDLSHLIKLGKKLVITLHDERLYTGGCHNSLNCNQFESSCIKCPQASFIGKKLIHRTFESELTKLRNIQSELTLITPSNWMLDRIKSSTKLANIRVHKISNPIPDVYFKSSRFKSSNFQWNRSKRCVLGFCAAKLNDGYKGLKYLLLALQNILTNSAYQFELVVIGEGNLPLIDLPIYVNKIFVDDDKQMSNVLESLDLLVVPSVGDNAPNVIAEAQATGTKVIGSNVGGIPEMLEFDSNLIFDLEIPNSLEECIKRNLFLYDRRSISDKAKKTYSYSEINKLYSGIYKNK